MFIACVCSMRILFPCFMWTMGNQLKLFAYLNAIYIENISGLLVVKLKQHLLNFNKNGCLIIIIHNKSMKIRKVMLEIFSEWMYLKYIGMKLMKLSLLEVYISSDSLFIN